ncbi:hypothetical protein JCM11641_002301 [Rhodosporidiobolus odoratus]
MLSPRVSAARRNTNPDLDPLLKRTRNYGSDEETGPYSPSDLEDDQDATARDDSLYQTTATFCPPGYPPFPVPRRCKELRSSLDWRPAPRTMERRPSWRRPLVLWLVLLLVSAGVLQGAVFSVGSLYQISQVLRMVPCSLHLQERCFGNERGWRPAVEAVRSERSSSLDGNVRFQEECGGGRWSSWMREFESRQRRFMDGDSTIPVVIWRCDTFYKCHGWGDRIGGLQTSFLLALLTDRAFLIKSDRPAPMGFFLRPSSPSLSFEYEDYRQSLAGRSSQVIRNDNMLWETMDEYSRRNWKETLRDVVWVRSNIPAMEALLDNPSLSTHPLASRLSSISPRSLPGCMVNYLLTPVPALQAKIDTLLPSLPPQSDPSKTPTVALQIRVGDQVLEDPHALVSPEAWRWQEECLSDLVAEAGSTVKPRYFLTSDSVAARNHFINELSPTSRVFSSATPPTHVNAQLPMWSSLDQRLNRSLASFHDTLLEWYALQRADLVISSRSNFAVSAALSSFLLDSSPSSPSPSSPSSSSASPPPLRGLFVQGNLPSTSPKCSLSTPKQNRGQGIQAWWFWCQASHHDEHSHWGMRDDMTPVIEEWCKRWGWPVDTSSWE